MVERVLDGTAETDAGPLILIAIEDITNADK